jgi:hypothetical protein
MQAFCDFLHGIGSILNKWTDELSVQEKSAICASWGDWTPNDVEAAGNDPHSIQAFRVHDVMLGLFWTNKRPIRTRVWRAP